MKQKYIKPSTSIYNISPKKYAVGLPITSEYDEEDSRQARDCIQSFKDNSTSENIWEEWK